MAKFFKTLLAVSVCNGLRVFAIMVFSGGALILGTASSAV